MTKYQIKVRKHAEASHALHACGNVLDNDHECHECIAEPSVSSISALKECQSDSMHVQQLLLDCDVRLNSIWHVIRSGSEAAMHMADAAGL